MSAAPVRPSSVLRLLGFLTSLPWVVGLLVALAALVGSAAWRGTTGSLLQSGPFLALAGGLALCMALAAWRRRPYTLPRLGFLLAHTAPALIVGGLAADAAAGWSGFLPLGDPALGTGLLRLSEGRAGAPRVTLSDLSLRLERMDPLGSVPPFVVTAYRTPEGQTPERIPGGLPPEAGARWPIAAVGLEVRIETVLPNAVDRGAFREMDGAPENPVLRVLLGLGSGEPLLGDLEARHPEGCRKEAPGGAFSVAFQERFEPSLPARLAPPRSGADGLVLWVEGRPLSHGARPGDTWDLPGFSLQVHPQRPEVPARLASDGPWLGVTLRTQDGQRADLLLSARNPGLSDRLNAPSLPPGTRLHYHAAGVAPGGRVLLFTREDQRVRHLEAGRVLREEPLVLGRPVVVARGRSATPVALMAHGHWVPDCVPHPEPDQAGRFLHPAVKVVVSDPRTGASETGWLRPPEEDDLPTLGRFMGGRLALAFHPKEPEGRDLRAVVRAFDAQGVEVARSFATVASPLRLSGLRVEPAVAEVDGVLRPGLAVHRRPGTTAIRAGLALTVIGMAWMFFLKPWLKGRALRPVEA